MASRAPLKSWEGYRFNAYEGTAEQLVGAGVARFDQLPGQPGMPKTAVYFSSSGERISRQDGRGPGDVHITRTSTRRFIVYVGITQEEEDRRAKIAERAREAKAAEAKAKWDLELLPDSHAAFREKVIDTGGWVLEMFERLAAGVGGGGYYFDRETRDRIVAGTAGLKALLASGTVHFSSSFRAERIEEITKPLRKDPAFKSFMRGITASD